MAGGMDLQSMIFRPLSSSTMTKRKGPHSYSQESETIFTSKRSRPSNDDDNSSSANQPQTDPTYGQKGAFPGLDHSLSGDDDDALFYGPANDGLEYLRMVRYDCLPQQTRTRAWTLLMTFADRES